MLFLPGPVWLLLSKIARRLIYSLYISRSPAAFHQSAVCLYLKIPRVLLALKAGLEGAIRRWVDAEVERGPLGRGFSLGGELRLDGDQMVADRPVVAILGPIVLGRPLSHDPGSVHVIVVDDTKNHGSD